MRKIVDFFRTHYARFLFVVVLFSYGQLLLMTPWQDDQTLFFKLQHLSEKAGYFGAGPFGEGPYRYIITPFIPIYQFFGLNPVYYYLLALAAYFVATYVVYKVISSVVNEKAGRISGFLFAAGYVSSDSFIRLFNSVVTSVSVITVGLFTLFYWKFYKTKKLKWYFFAVVAFLAAIEFVRTRTHYLITLPILFELIFFVSTSFKKHLLKSLIRLAPFLYIFYLYFVKVADTRGSQIKVFVASLLHGDFSIGYGFLSSITNLVIPDWLSAPIIQNLSYRTLLMVAFGGLAILFWAVIKRKSAVLAILLSGVWFFLSKRIFTTPLLNLAPKDLIFPYLGVVFLVLSLFPLKLLKKDARKLYLFFLLWTLFNLGAYSAYNPGLAHSTIHRYLTHSFVPFVALLGLSAALAFEKKKIISRAFLFGIAIWGIGNLLNSFFYQRNIVLTRSIPVKKFYSQLKTQLPTLQKGDVLYFDVAEDARGYFSDAFSVASMPEETAIAWRYEIDRYDIRRVTDYETLTKLITDGGFTDINREPLVLNSIYSFFYSRDGLVETTDQLLPLLKGRSRAAVAVAKTEAVGNDVIIDLAESIVSLVPVEINLTLTGILPDISGIKFPLIADPSLAANSVAYSETLRSLAFDYKTAKERLQKAVRVSAASFWQKEVEPNLIDGRSDTNWRADRVLWSKEETGFTLDLGGSVTIDRFVWVNGNASNSPTKYEIEVSTDGKSWKKVAQVEQSARIERVDLQVVSFKPAAARFVKMILRETLSRDSASIAEAWVVPTAFADIDIKEAEQFLENPLGFVPDAESFTSTLSQMGYVGNVQVSWFGDKSDTRQTREDKMIQVKYDGTPRTYRLVLPAGGTEIYKLELTQNQIKGDLSLVNIEIDE